MAPLRLFVGSLNREAPYFQGARGVGLSVHEFDEDTLETRQIAETGEVDNPTFLSINADGTCIYANSEVFAWREGTVSAYRFDPGTGQLVYLNKQPTLGSIAAHNSVMHDGRKLLVANYGMGAGGPDQSVVVFGIREDGSLTPPLGSVAHQGSGPDPARQERAHAHSATEIVGGGMVIVADLGLDALLTYRVGDEGRLAELGRTTVAPGAGPRHVALHPNGRFVFVMNELDSTVASLLLDSGSGALSIVNTQPAVPAKARQHNHCADIQISPDGRFIYGSNRGHDSISIFGVDQSSGELTPEGFTPCGGSTPRNLCLTPSGRHLLSANQNADRISIFERDARTGQLSDTGAGIKVGTPMCIRISR